MGIFLLIISVLVIAIVIISIGQGSDYWTTEWNSDDTDPDGIWVADMLINFEDGTSKSYKAIKDSIDNPFTVYHEGNPISTCTLRLGMITTGTYPECEIDLENFVVTKIARRHFDEDGNIIMPPEIPVLNEVLTGLSASNLIIPVNNNPSLPVWHPDFNVVIDLETLHQDNYWQEGTYIVGYNFSGSGKFRGIDDSNSASVLMGSWNSLYPPSEVGAFVTVDPLKVMIEFTTSIDFEYL